MKTMQDRIIDQIEQIAENELGLAVTQQQEWANTGHLIFTRTEQFQPLCDLAYSFQTEYAIFDWRTDGKTAIRGVYTKEPGCGHASVTYAEWGSVNEFLFSIKDALLRRLELV